MPASLPRASNVAKAGSSPVRTLLFAGPLLFTFENTQKAFTFPENWNAHPLDICIVRPCALAVAETPSAKPNNNSVRRFIRDSSLGVYLANPTARALEAPTATARGARYSRVGTWSSHQSYLVWLLTYSCVSKQGKAEPTSLRASPSCCAPPPRRPHQAAPAS